MDGHVVAVSSFCLRDSGLCGVSHHFDHSKFVADGAALPRCRGVGICIGRTADCGAGVLCICRFSDLAVGRRLLYSLPSRSGYDA